jgi:hypothetical protein
LTSSSCLENVEKFKKYQKDPKSINVTGMWSWYAAFFFIELRFVREKTGAR